MARRVKGPCAWLAPVSLGLAVCLIGARAGQAAPNDTAILSRALELLATEEVWNREDTRECPARAPRLSLYCALRQATEEVLGASFHRTPAMEAVRALIDERGVDYPHRLMGFNNDPDVALSEVHALLREAAAALERRTAAIPQRRFDQMLELEAEAATSANASAADVDGDGDVDVLLARGRHWPLHNRILLNDGSGGFAEARDLGPLADRTYTAALADLDGDGDPDAAVSNDRPDEKRLYWNDGHGRFTPGAAFGDASWPTRNLTVADLDGDGRPDLVLANRQSPSSVCLNAGAENPWRCTRLATESATTIAAADFDDDGAVDLAVPHRDGGTSVLLWNDGRGGFGERTEFGLAPSSARTAATGDLDGDSLPDLVVGDERRGTFVHLNLGGRRLDAALPLGDLSRVPYAIAIADLNGDGALDVVVGYAEAPGAVFLGDGSGRNFREERWSDGAGVVYGIAIADLDADGWPDLVAARSGATNAVWWNRPPAANP